MHCVYSVFKGIQLHKTDYKYEKSYIEVALFIFAHLDFSKVACRGPRKAFVSMWLSFADNYDIYNDYIH